MEDLGFSEQDRDALEREFQDIINELANEPALERFRQEYTKLHQAFRNAYDQERRLLRKLRDINSDILNNAGKVTNALKFSQEDSERIKLLKTELDNTYKVIEQAQMREDKLKQKIENFQAEIKHLQDLVEQGNALQSQTNKITELQTQKEDFIKERDSLQAELIKNRSETGNLIEKLKLLENEKLILDQSSQQLKKNLQEMQEKVDKDEQRRNNINEELEQLRQNYIKTKKEYEKQKEDLSKVQVELKKQTETLQKKDIDKEIEENELKNLRDQVTDVKKIYKEIMTKKEENEDIRESNEAEIIKLKNEKNNARTHLNQIEKKNNNLNKKLLRFIETKRQNYKRQGDRHVTDTKKFNEQDQQLLEELRKAHINFANHKAKSEEYNSKLNEKINLIDKEIESYEKEILQLQEEVDEREKQFVINTKKKEKFGKDAALINAKFLHSQEEIKLKDNLISEFQKKNIETDNKLKQQQHLYEEVRSDRNLYSKNLLETQDEIAVIKRRHKIVQHQIAQLKEEIDAKEVALAKEHFEHKKKDKTIEECCRILEKNRKEIEEKEETIKNYVGEISKLHFVLKDSEIKRQKLKEEYETVVSERDILGMMNQHYCMRKLRCNKKLWHMENMTIELLKFKISDLQRELGQAPILKEKINNLQKDLVEEKLRVKALSEELENPLNPQRCKKLGGSDPDVYEMKQKIKTLQRRLIYKTEQVVEKEVLIQQKEKQILELRDIMRKQPGLEEATQISKLQEQMKAKTRQMKSLAAELNMYQAQINEYKYDIERLNKELQETNRKYLEQRRREQIQQEQQQLMEQNQQNQQPE
ncbi:unnamed protein product (macronuclear) [Paramecium tetraurelia]|uniref:Cilia- and flagella-associated protein 58 central coiled coil domain-containing protein n=1 Tax=Paramecium tetraurelia TaxID=5888 RepID=A0DQP9_PARTE|nr:uncharacterized protein GSPATT00002766001 [Paramecium tetraurelia]CAK85366.1 unnamed protein product [Paramecium tetraurelia]|eukprot:XP_001452763.1 hypothetical protein (macronuclear) [Paramecium tetraurelia strain d4-2]